MSIYALPPTLVPAMKRPLLRRLTFHPRLLLPILALAAPSPAPAGEGGAPPPDLRLEWLIEGRRARTPDAVHGTAGEVIRLDYVLLNVGGAPAFAVVLSATTTLGPLPASQRLQPGPAPGQSLRRSLRLPLATGVRQVCVQARLQMASAHDPGDPNPDDNLLCREVIVKIRDNAAPPAGRAPARTPTEMEQ